MIQDSSLKQKINRLIQIKENKEENVVNVNISDIATEKQTKIEELRRSRLALMNILEDVEEAKEIAEKERDKTLAIITNFTDGLLVLDKENRVLIINPKAEEFLKVKKKEIVGQLISKLAQFPNCKPLIDLLKRENKKIFRRELLIKENLILEISTVLITKEKKKLETLIILHDITREKMVEKTKNEFVSIAAHQLRTPLSAIKWTMRMLLDKDLGEITEEQKNFIEKAYKSNEKMIRLINDLLDLSKIEEGRYLYEHTPCQIKNIVQSVIDYYQEIIDKKKLKIKFNTPKKKLPQVIVDKEKIKLAIQNLLDNAIKYTPSHGEIIISLKYAKKEIEFSIKDTGIGIPKDQQKRIFSKFFRTVETTKMETDGTGLGLFIAKNIIKAHKGKIWFDSLEAKGTTFYFTLPIYNKNSQKKYILKKI